MILDPIHIEDNAPLGMGEGISTQELAVFISVIRAILNPLAAAGISILSISTFDTDYVLVRSTVLEEAKAALRRHFELEESPTSTFLP